MRYFGDLIPVPKPLEGASASFVTTKELATTSGLTEEQKEVILELQKGNSVVVDSVFGAGKTRTLQEICNVFDDRRILYLTYNRLLKLDAQNKIKNKNTTVQNYHGFVYKYLVRRGIKVQPDKQIKTFLAECTDIPLVYDMICVDEFQDLEEDTVALLLHLAAECPRAQWIFVGDMRQKIYDKTKVDVYKDCINKICSDYTPLAFTQCFRVSDEHAKFLSQLWDKDIKGVNEDCQVIKTSNFNKVLSIIDETDNKDILILGPRYGLAPEIVNILERRNPRKYNKNTVWTSIRDKTEYSSIQPGSLIVTTYDGCKGMERPICIVLDWTDTHFRNRVEKPFVDQTIIRNLFCVAAGRGKDKIVFYLNPQHKSAKFLAKKNLVDSYIQELPTYRPSDMFDFKHPADVLACMELLEIEDIPQEDTTVLTATMNDANIDLSPVVGMYQEIIFFAHYNFQKVLDSLEPSPMLERIKKHIEEKDFLTPEYQALALAAESTQLFRYCNQANEDFVTTEQKEALLERLASKLDPNSEKVQVPCHIVADFTADGRIDYIDKEGAPWELKFVGSLGNTHYLQAAMYSIMKASKYRTKDFTYLWNVRTNELKKVRVTDKDKFLELVYKCITMGRKLRRS